MDEYKHDFFSRHAIRTADAKARHDMYAHTSQGNYLCACRIRAAAVAFAMACEARDALAAFNGLRGFRVT